VHAISALDALDELSPGALEPLGSERHHDRQLNVAVGADHGRECPQDTAVGRIGVLEHECGRALGNTHREAVECFEQRRRLSLRGVAEDTVPKSGQGLLANARMRPGRRAEQPIVTERAIYLPMCFEEWAEGRGVPLAIDSHREDVVGWRREIAGPRHDDMMT